MDSGGRQAASPASSLLLFYFFYNTVHRDVNIFRFRDSHLTLETKVHLALILNAHQKHEKEKSKQGKKDLRNQNAEEGNMYFVYMMKCSLFSCGLSFCICFFVLLLLLLFVNILVKKKWPPFSSPPVRHLVKELAYTKAPRPSFMHWPPSSYFISSVPMLVLFTLCTIFLKLVITALRANLMLLQQL